MDCYERLANAVIIQAVKDYRRAYRKCRNGGSSMAMAEVRALERFFCSEWFAELTDADGRALLRKIKEMEDGRNRA